MTKIADIKLDMEYKTQGRATNAAAAKQNATLRRHEVRPNDNGTYSIWDCGPLPHLGESKPETETTDENAEKAPKSVVAKKYRPRYGRDQNNGDMVARAMLKHTVVIEKSKHLLQIEKVAEVAKQNGLDMSRWDHLNTGMQRMNLANRLRQMLKDGVDVTIGKTKIRSDAFLAELAARMGDGEEGEDE